MVQLYGRAWTRQEIQGYTGHPAQLGGIRPIELTAGRARGVRAYEVTTGTGFACTILADRALDISQASYRGHSLAYLAPGGEAHPAFYEPQGPGWLRTFPGGLLTTCGLSQVGAPSEDAGEALGLHGRIAHLPMEEIGAWTSWEGDLCTLHLKGRVTEGVIFGNPLRLAREITARLGESRLTLQDTVENLGGEPAPLMLLYHCNLGFPLLGPEAQLIANSQVTPRDAAAAAGMADYARFQPPTPGYTEQVFYHEMKTDVTGDVRVALVNPALEGGLGVYLRYHQKHLPRFVQWKMMGYGTYVLGLEPSNCLVDGRAAARARGELDFLQPGEARTFTLEIGVLDGMAAIDACSAQIGSASRG